MDRGSPVPSRLFFCTKFFSPWSLLLLGSLSAPPSYSRISPTLHVGGSVAGPGGPPKAYVAPYNKALVDRSWPPTVQAATSLPALMGGAAMLPTAKNPQDAIHGGFTPKFSPESDQ